MSHIAISVPDMGAMFKKLKELNTKYRQISIYGMEKKPSFNPIPTTKKSYIKDHPRAESALVYIKSSLVLSLYCSDVSGGVVVSTTGL